MTLVHAPLHALRAPRRGRAGVAVAVLAVVLGLLALGLYLGRPTPSSWRARDSRPLPAALSTTSGGVFALGLVALEDPAIIVFGALGEPDLRSSSASRTTMSWTFEGSTVVVSFSTGPEPKVVALDAYVSTDAESGPVFAGGIEVGRSTMGALVGRLGPPTDVGQPLPTSARWIRPYRGATGIIDADAGAWASMLSGRIGHLHIGYDESGRFDGLFDPDRR